MKEIRKKSKSVVFIGVVLTIFILLPATVSADIVFDTTVGGDWMLDDDKIDNRKFDLFDLVGSNEIPRYWDVAPVSTQVEFHDDCSTTSGWTYSSTWPNAMVSLIQNVPIYTSSGRIYSGSIPSNPDHYHHGPVYYKTLPVQMKVADSLDLKVDVQTVYSYGYMGDVYVTMYDTNNAVVGGVRLHDSWYSTRSDANVYYYKKDGTSVWQSVTTSSSWSGVLRVWYDSGTGSIKGSALGSTWTLYSSGQFDSNRYVKYITIQFAANKNYNYNSPYVRDILLTCIPPSGTWNIHDSTSARSVTTSARIYSTTGVRMSQQLDVETTDVIRNHNIHYGFWFKSSYGKSARACFEYTDSVTKTVVGDWIEPSSESGYLAWTYAYVEISASIINTIDSGTQPKVIVEVSASPTGYIYIDDADLAIFYTVGPVDVLTSGSPAIDLGECSMSLFVWSHDWDPVEDHKRNMYVTASIHCKTIDHYEEELVAIDGFVFQIKMLPETWFIIWTTSQTGIVDITSIQEANDQDFFDRATSAAAMSDATMIAVTSTVSNTVQTAIVTAEGAAGLLGGIVVDMAIGTIFEIASVLSDEWAGGPGWDYIAWESVGYVPYNSGQGYGENMIRDATFTTDFVWSYWTRNPANPNIILPYEDFSIQIMGRAFVQTYMSPSSVWRYSYTDIYQNIELSP
ncbi:MAG: hypothetical protein JW779_11840 [Candidatus Thorarchaeota archaeon]|nr:hypothetical protein [Candidatus Thorarchaeota archaeon]